MSDSKHKLRYSSLLITMYIYQEVHAWYFADIAYWTYSDDDICEEMSSTYFDKDAIISKAVMLLIWSEECQWSITAVWKCKAINFFSK